jgi:hypothetical protein
MNCGRLDGSVQGILVSGLEPDPLRAHAEEEPSPDLEAQAMIAMGLGDDLIEVPRREYDRLMIEASAEAREIERTLAEAHEREERQREQAAQEAGAMWPAVRDFMGWGWDE